MPSLPAVKDLGEPPKVFGLLLLEQKKALARIVGNELLEQGIARMEPTLRGEIENLSMFSWCSTAAAAHFMISVAQAAGRDPERLTAQVVREGFGVVMRTVWQLFTRYATDEALVHRAGMIYTKAISRGRVRASVEGIGHLALDVSDWPGMTRIDLVAIATGIEVCLAASGRQRIRVLPSLRSDGARFDVRLAESSLPPPESA